MTTNSSEFSEVKETGEHPVENYLLFKKYVEIVEKNLEEFLNNEKINAQRLFDACKRVKEEDETSLYSLDYILACTEYEDFYNLMIQYKEMYNYEYDDDQFDFSKNK